MQTPSRYRSSIFCTVCVLIAAASAVAQQADLAITKDNGQSQGYPGQRVTYTITITNYGPDDAIGAVVQDTLPAALKDAEWASTTTGAATTTVGLGTGDLADTVTVPIGDLIVYTVVADIDTGFTGELSNTVTITTPSDPNPNNDTSTDTDQVVVEEVANIRAVYDNAVPTPNAVVSDATPAPDNGAAAFGGHMGDRSAPVNATLRQPRYILRNSSFGQPLARYKASPTFEQDTIDNALGQLFYVSGAPTEQNNAAAFRYINTFFNIGTTGVVDGLQMRLDESLPYDATIDPNDGEESDEERALRVAEDVKDALRVAPFNKDLRNLLLDIYYYRTLGRQAAAKDQVVRAYQINFSTEVSEQEPFGGPINKEIAAFNTAANALSGVLDPYKELLFDGLGVDINEFDSSFTGHVPFGYYLFLKEVPYRSVYAATFVDYNASTGELTGDPEPIDLGDTANFSVLVATPTGFGVQYDGKPEGGTEAAVTFNVKNVGTAELNWTATVQNPKDTAGTILNMLTLGNNAGTLSGTVAVSGSTSVKVNIATNTSPLNRTGEIIVKDTGGGSEGLVYRVVIVQSGNPKPIIGVSMTDIIGTETWIEAGYLVESQVIVRNEGTGTLNWTADILVNGSAGSVDWLKIQGPDQDERGNEASGTDYGVLKVFADPSIDYVHNPVQIRIKGDDPKTAPVFIDVYYENNPPSKAAGSELLTVYPEEIFASATAVERDFAVLNSDAFSWKAAVTSGNSWLHVLSTDAESGLVRLSINQNASTQSREGTVTVTGTGTVPATCTVTVRQDGVGTTGLVVSPTTRNVTSASGVAQSGSGFTVARAGDGNVAWTAQVVKGQDWLSIYSGTSGQNEGEVLFAYDANTRISGRTGEILIESADALAGQDAVSVQVTQEGTNGAAVLSAGFKDLALIFDVMRDEANVRKELAKRYALRALSGDLNLANRLIAETLTRHTAALSDLGDIIPNWRQLADPSSDLLATYMGWQQAIDELGTTKDFLNGNANILGFQTDFLFLVQEFQGQSADLFDSYDKLFDTLYDGENDTAVLASPLGYAYDKYRTARAEYDNYTNTQDELREELRTQNLTHRKWLFDVVGADPGNDVDNPADAEHYYNPGGNYGGEIWLQERNIERAREQLRQNSAELQDIYNQINTELWRRSQEAQINAQMRDVYISYGDKLASIEEAIGAIEAAQALADNVADAFGVDRALSGGTAAKVINGFVQAAAEVAKGFLEGDKAQLAAQEQSEINQLEDQILGVNSQALIANLYGRASVIGIASGELVVALAQEVGTRQALIDEWHYREAQMRENNKALLGRAFANPVHRLRMRRAMIEAEGSFKVAQRWVFLTIRALEYKWNTPFVYNSPTGDWSKSSIFRARTAKDLLDLMAAVRDFDTLMQGSARGDDRFDWFSFKKDYLGLVPVYDTDGKTELRVYAHPLTGYAATATDVFRVRLEQAYNPETGIITLPFSTFKDNGETFFRGPRRDPNDPSVVYSRGQYLDKIVWMKVNLLGQFDTSEYQRVMGALSYAGGSYIRNARTGTIPDPARPDVIVNEFTRWPTKFWYYDSGVPDSDPPVIASWRSSDEQTTEISLNLTEQPRADIPDSVSQIDVFRERSVACDQWTLKIFTREQGQERLRIDQMDDIEFLFYHISKDRPALKDAEGVQ